MRRRKTCRRYNEPGHAHELTFSCFQRRAFLSRDRTRQYLVEAIVRARKLHGFDLWAYVIMPEHVHLLIRPRPKGYSIEAILASVKQPVSRRALIYLRKHRPEGLERLKTGEKGRPYRFWQAGGGYDRNITLDDTCRHMVHYIHNNPVRRDLAGRPAEWLWSSAREWETPGAGPISVDRESFPMG